MSWKSYLEGTNRKGVKEGKDSEEEGTKKRNECVLYKEGNLSVTSVPEGMGKELK